MPSVLLLLDLRQQHVETSSVPHVPEAQPPRERPELADQWGETWWHGGQIQSNALNKARRADVEHIKTMRFVVGGVHEESGAAADQL